MLAHEIVDLEVPRSIRGGGTIEIKGLVHLMIGRFWR